MVLNLPLPHLEKPRFHTPVLTLPQFDKGKSGKIGKVSKYMKFPTRKFHEDTVVVSDVMSLSSNGELSLLGLFTF